MAKYNRKILKRIGELTEKGTSIVDICTAVGISTETYFTWKKTKTDFSDELQAAEDRKYEFIRSRMPEPVEKLLFGHVVEYTETKSEPSGKIRADGKREMKVVEIHQKKKIFPPSERFVTTMLQALEPEKFKEDTHVKVTVESISNTIFSIKPKAIRPAETRQLPQTGSE